MSRRSSYTISPINLHQVDVESTSMTENYNRKQSTFPNKEQNDRLFIPTKNSRSFSIFSASSHGIDEIPRLENYSQEGAFKNVERPPLEVLHQPRKSIFVRWMQSHQETVDSGESENNESHKFGWFNGVYIPTFMNLLGAVVYLRLGWMTAQAGIILAVTQILIGFCILAVTVLSMTAICTNGKVGSGGFYYMISRSLGPETGTMFGIIYFITNAIMTAFNIVGTCEGIQIIFETYGIGLVEHPTGINDARILGLACLLLIIIIPFISLELEHKTQWILFFIVILSLIDYFIGTFLSPTEKQKAKGFVGWKSDTFIDNLLPKWDGESFFTVFAVYASSIAGDFTGATMSGTLKDASVAIPKGTIFAVATSSIVYIVLIVFLGSTVLAYVPTNMSSNFTCTKNSSCQFGLIKDYNTMALSAALTQTGIKVEPLIMAGLFAQTISSAMCSYISAPQIFQSLASDKVLPYIGWFAKGYGSLNEPRRGYLLVFFISIGFIAIGNFNLIATVISNCYLASWCLLNVSCFHADFVGAPNFRPSFKWFNKWISLMCGIVCLILMFLFDWISSIALIAIMVAIWLYMYKIKPAVNWGTTTDAQIFKIALSATTKLDFTNDHVKTYRPSILLLINDPNENFDLIQLANKITKNSGMMIVSEIRLLPVSYKERCELIEMRKNFHQENKIKCFYNLVEAKSLSEGVFMQIQCCGLGKLRPNIVMIEYLNNWSQKDENDLDDYFSIIHSTLEMHLSLVLYRNNHKSSKVQGSLDSGLELDNRNSNIFQDDRYSIQTLSVPSITQNENETIIRNMPQKILSSYSNLKHLLSRNNVSDIDKKQEFIDVWWVYDDGGLTLLLPYILSQRKQFKKCHLRIFTVAKDNEDVGLTKMNLSNLLTKLRIPFSDLNVFSQLGLPQKESLKRFNEILSKWMKSEDDETDCINNNANSDFNSQTLKRFKEKTNKYIRMSELLSRYSSESSLVVMTLPIPRKNYCPAPLFMSWLEILSGSMPPFLFIRGNQTDVLTFYCE